MPLSPGDKLGHYEVLSLLGVGGQGEVYKARDTRLDRDVAVKVLPEYIAKREDLRARFEREARAVASLKHPNICVLYDIGKHDGVGSYMVMEFMEGETLAARIEKGALPLDQALKFATQIADALDRAHRAGVTHRDVKPQNIMLTRDGVKVLDFGLAKSSSKPGPTEATLTAVLTTEGTIMGTPQYMAPEQFEGKEADARSDIWAFGAVLYEMVTGQKAFQGKSYASLLGAILSADPPPMSVKPFTPVWLERLVKRCLQKDPDDRYQSMRDVVLDLSMPPQESAAVAEDSAPSQSRLGKIGWIAAALFAVAALALGLVAYRHMIEEPPRVTKTFVLPPEKGTFASRSIPAVSPDGRHLAFVATTEGKQELWVRDLDSLVARPLAGTEGATDPFWAPDSRSVGFFTLGKLKKIEVAGGPALTLCETTTTNAYGGSWSKNDVIVFATNGTFGIFRVSSGGGSATRVTELDRTSGEASHRNPWFLPDGRHFLYTIPNNGAEKTAVYVGDVDSKDGATNRQRVLAANSMAVYASPGYLLFLRERTLMAQPFDTAKLQTTGDAQPIAEQIDVGSGIVTQSQFSVSQNGVLAYISGGEGGGSRLAWYDRQGKVVNTAGEAGPYGPLALSPDGTRVAVQRTDGMDDLWVIEFARGTSTRFTFDPGTDYEAVWSPDGSQLVWASNRKGANDLYRRASTGAGEEQALLVSSDTKNPQDWSPDGRFLLYSLVQKGNRDLWLLPLKADGAAGGPPIAYLTTPFEKRSAQFSPDGHWVAYASTESGTHEVYVKPFPLPAGGGGKWQISTGGGYQPLWRHDGKELLYFSPESKLMSVDVSGVASVTEPSFKAASPKPLFSAAIAGGPAVSSVHRWAIAPDGQHFLISVEAESSASAPMTVVLNWQAGLKK